MGQYKSFKALYKYVPFGDITLKLHADLLNAVSLDFLQYTHPSIIQNHFYKCSDIHQDFLQKNIIKIKGRCPHNKDIAGSTFEFVNGFANIALLKKMDYNRAKPMVLTLEFDENCDPIKEASAYLLNAHLLFNPSKKWEGEVNSSKELRASLREGTIKEAINKPASVRKRKKPQPLAQQDFLPGLREDIENE